MSSNTVKEKIMSDGNAARWLKQLIARQNAPVTPERLRVDTMSKVRDVRWNGRAYDAGSGVRDNSLPVSSAAIIADGVVDQLAKRYPDGSDERMAWEIQSRILRGVSNKQQWVFEGLKYSDERKEMTALADRMIERSPISLDGVDEEERIRIDALRGAIEREREILKRLHDKKFTLFNVVVNHEGYLDALPDDMRDAANRYVDTIGAMTDMEASGNYNQEEYAALKAEAKKYEDEVNALWSKKREEYARAWESGQGECLAILAKIKSLQTELHGTDVEELEKKHADIENAISGVTDTEAQSWVDSRLTITFGRGVKNASETLRKIKSWAKDFYRFTNGKMKTDVTIKVDGVGRAYAKSNKVVDYVGRNTVVLYMSDMSKRVLWHELGHILEVDPVAAAAANAFLLKRETRGGEVRTMNKIDAELKGKKQSITYDADEVGVTDGFIHPYMGRVYATGATEVFSVALEHMSEPETAAEFMKADPECAMFLFGYLSGKDNADNMEMMNSLSAAVNDRAIELNQEATDERAARMEEVKNDDRFVFVRDKAFKAYRSPLYNAIFNLGVFRKGFKCVMGGAIYLKPYSLMVVAFNCSGYKVGRRTVDVYVVMSFRVDGLDVSESTSMDAAIDRGSEFKLVKVVDSLSGGVESALAMYALDFEKQNPI